MQYRDSTLEFGPCYNPLLQNGLPVLGSWMNAPILSCMAPSSISEAPLKSFVPLSGPVILKSIWISKDHDIQFDCGIRNDLPALLLKEDFDVAVILVFLEKIDAIPHFGLSAETRGIFRKVWNSPWLEFTDIGKTFYACHQFLNALVFNTPSFEIAKKQKIFNQDWYGPVTNMLEELQYVVKKSHIDRTKNTAHFNLIDFKKSISGEIDNISHDLNNWRIDIIDASIDFYVCDQEGNTIDPISSFLRFNREAFPQLIPNFERLRQIQSLILGLIFLRESNYKMPKEMVENYQRIKLSYEELLQWEQKDSYCYLLPLEE